MKLLFGHKDGGPESEVTCYGIEIKSLFSIMLLRFTPRTREAYHSHAFNCINWVLRGVLFEEIVVCPNRHVYKGGVNGLAYHYPSLKPFTIWRNTYHRVRSMAWSDRKRTLQPNSWVLTIRGPWVDRWIDDDRWMTHGRKRISQR